MFRSSRAVDITAIVAILAAGTLLPLAAPHHYVADAASNFAVQCFLLAVPAFAAAVAVKKWKTSAAAFALVFFHGTTLAPYWLPSAPAHSSGSASLAVMLANVNTANRNTAGLIELVRNQKPDILVINEADQFWLDQLKVLESHYPSSIRHPRSDNFGIALYSKFPVSDSRIEFADNLPFITARIALGQEEIQVIAAHPLPPVSAQFAAQRNRELAQLGDLAAKATRPLLLVGDLNATPWSPAFRRAFASSELLNLRIGQGVLPSWPAVPWLAPLLIPIDHCLVSKDFELEKIGTEPIPGSDHKALLIRLTLLGKPA